MMKQLRLDYPTSVLSRMLVVSASGYYAWMDRGPSRRAREEVRLELESKAAHKRTRQTYGPERLQRDRLRSSQRVTSRPQDIADELWFGHESGLDLLQSPEDFVTRSNEGDIFDLPSGEVEVGTALMDIGDLLKVGTIRVGGRDGEVIDVGSVSRGRFLEALSLCHHTGQVRLPGDEVCDDAVSSFAQYRQDLQDRCSQLAQQRTPDQRRQKAIVNALLRKALQWQRA